MSEKKSTQVPDGRDEKGNTMYDRAEIVAPPAPPALPAPPVPPALLKHFRYEHLPGHLQAVSRPFCELARYMVDNLPNCAERTAGLRKLLEAKDCAVRAALED